MNRGNSADAVKLLEKTAGAKVKFVHVVRNPFDNIATMVLEHRNVKARYGEHKIKVWSKLSMEEVYDRPTQTLACASQGKGPGNEFERHRAE